MADGNNLSELGNFEFNDKLSVSNGKFQSTSGNINLSGNKSLFQKNVIIDYARLATEPKNWENFKKNGDLFVANNNTLKLNEAVKGDVDDDKGDGQSIHSLIAWSEKYPALQLRYQDFVYCRNIGFFPNNRLIVLRRFKNGVPDNLFDYQVKNTNANSNSYLYTQPLATMITWLKPDEAPITLSFNEGWEGGSSIAETFAKLKSDFGGKNDSLKTFNNFDSSILGAVLDELGGDFIRIDGVEFLGRAIEGNPNLVTGSAKRTTGVGGKNIVSTITFSLTFEYEMRYHKGVDPGIAILDLMANCFRMGTSVSEFKYPIKFLTNDTLITNIINGDFEVNFTQFQKSLTGYFQKVEKGYTDIINSIKTTASSTISDSTSKLADKAVKQFISVYRESLKAALAYDTGMPSGIWHVTIGNPKNPILSCGDLVVRTSTLELGKELGYNDFPNSFTCKYELFSARSRGRDELERIFNAGRGRVYVYEDWKLNPDYDKYTDK
jgi:hypothetical protein